jgi:hypothetical protein
MSPTVRSVVSDMFYHGLLLDGNHLSSQDPRRHGLFKELPHVVILDLSGSGGEAGGGCGGECEYDSKAKSSFNAQEARVVARVHKWLRLKLDESGRGQKGGEGEDGGKSGGEDVADVPLSVGGGFDMSRRCCVISPFNRHSTELHDAFGKYGDVAGRGGGTANAEEVRWSRMIRGGRGERERGWRGKEKRKALPLLV